MIEDVINSAGFTSQVETLNVNTAWLGSIPGNCYANIRRPLINSLDFIQMIPTGADYNGQPWNHHLNGPALFGAKTDSHMPFWFSPHVEDVGHMMVLGPTGSGKSVFLNLMAASFQKYENHQIYFFDKGYSAYVNTLLNGGVHYDLGDNKDLAFQPLLRIDNENIRTWAQNWLIENVLIPENISITPQIKNELWDALTNLSTSPENQRTITHLNALVQNDEVRMALHTITVDGSIGYLLDAETDMMSNNKWQTFEMGHLMEYLPQGIKPTLSYLFFEIDQSLNGQPTIIIIDESWTFFEDETSSKKIKQWLKELRKKNAFVVFGTQSIADASKSSLIYTLIESCPTRIFLPNKKALNTEIFDLYKSFGLNDKQIDIIARAIPKRDYYCQSDIGNRLFDLDLGPIGLAVCGSSSKVDIQTMKELAQGGGEKDLIAQYFGYKNVYEN
jgi:type IV secretion system protein VirB4